jgi:hypothetical protein
VVAPVCVLVTARTLWATIAAPRDCSGQPRAKAWGRKATGLPLATGGLWQPGCQERGKTPPPCCRGCFICAGQSWSGKAEVEAMNWLHGALALAVWAILAIGPLWHAARAG